MGFYVCQDKSIAISVFTSEGEFDSRLFMGSLCNLTRRSLFEKKDKRATYHCLAYAETKAPLHFNTDDFYENVFRKSYHNLTPSHLAVSNLRQETLRVSTNTHELHTIWRFFSNFRICCLATKNKTRMVTM